ncbi:hypothetical protein RBE51_17590 [Pseudomonas taiwanensis]|uniref:hypothetical protein n=1 Tax=Pseudomonas taiwanensis TaxID=470150 RepID=UPI0028DD5353|nr:hypothetical protein [Pseudomonas taiwanensis]MDT8924623.1 hypothetical protein [Pseudomonas taiwanensis]
MKSLIERNPKEQAVAESIRNLASPGYTRQIKDPVDDIFEVVGRIERQIRLKKVDGTSRRRGISRGTNQGWKNLDACRYIDTKYRSPPC